MGSISGQVQARCKECNCRFLHSIDNWIFIDEEAIGTCDNCFNKKSHTCIDEFQGDENGCYAEVGRKEFNPPTKLSAEGSRESGKIR